MNIGELRGFGPSFRYASCERTEERMSGNKPMKLNDLFRVGKMVTVPITGEGGKVIEFNIWMRKPSATQHEEALSSARAKQARVRLQYADEGSDQYAAIADEMNQYTSKTELIDKVLSFDFQRMRQAAINEVLYDPEQGQKWGEYGEGYSDLIAGIAQRMDEIQNRNAELGADETELRVLFDEDPELLKLLAKREEFEAEVDALVQAARDVEISKYKLMSIDELRKTLWKLTVDAQAQMAWYEEYRLRSLWFACRETGDRVKPYFETPYDILDLPPGVINTLLNHYDELDQGGEAVKNLLSLQPS
jgi:hypothetical protein